MGARIDEDFTHNRKRSRNGVLLTMEYLYYAAATFRAVFTTI